MQYRTLGKTGLRVSVIGLGTWQFGGEWGQDFTQAQADAIVGAAQEAGINLVDTAECYGDHLSERFVGKALRGRRDQWVVATKFGHRFDGLFKRQEAWSPAEVQTQLEASLRALGTDHVDLYQFHSGSDAAFDRDDLWEMLRRQVEKGTVRHLGISVSSKGSQHQVDRASAVGAESIQVVYNRLDRRPEEAVFPSCQRQGLGVLARVPLASGYLSGKYKPGARFAATDVRSTHDQAEVERKLAEVERIGRDEVPAGVPMARWALAWCLRHPAVSAVIPGARNVEQVRENAAAGA